MPGGLPIQPTIKTRLEDVVGESVEGQESSEIAQAAHNFVYWFRDMDMEAGHCNQITQVSLKTLAFPLPRLKVLIIKMLSPQSYSKGNLQRFYTVQNKP